MYVGENNIEYTRKPIWLSSSENVMPIPSVCPNCKTASDVPIDLAGKRVKCPKCKEPMRIPTADSEEGFEVVVDDPPIRKSISPASANDDFEADVAVRKKRRPIEDLDDDEPVRKRSQQRKDDDSEDHDYQPRNRRSDRRSRDDSTGVSPIRYVIGSVVLIALLVVAYIVYSSKFVANDDDLQQKDPVIKGKPIPGIPDKPIGRNF